MDASLPLPVEILGGILQQIEDYQTLYLLALVCRTFYLEASMILYRSPKNLSPNRHITFLSSLASDPRLARFVRNYKLPPIVGRQRITCWELLRVTLPMMTNLKELSIMATANEMHILSMPKLIFQVENLSWIQIDSAKSDQFTRWIQSQKSMKHLRWIHRGAVEVSRSAFPGLVSLEGNMHVVEALMPGRSIQRLHWIADAFYNGEFNVSKRLAVEMGRLQSLTFENRPKTIEYSMIASHLHSLTFLELVGDFHKSDMAMIPIPPTLRILVFSLGTASKNDAVFQVDGSSDAISHIFEKATNLVRIDITAERKAKVDLYERWEEGIRKQALVHSDIVHESCRMFSPSLY